MRRVPLLRIAAAGALAALYAFTCYGDVGYWDTGEMDVVPYTLGLAHPPGFPLYVLLGWVFAHVVALGSVAFRMSLLSAICMAAAAYAAGQLVADETNEDAVPALAAQMLFGLGGIAWSIATRADVHAAFCAVAAWWLVCALRWRRTGANRDLVLAAAFYGCAVAVHPLALTLLPAALTLTVMRLATTPSRTLLSAFAIAAACAILPYASLALQHQSLRSATGIIAYLDAAGPLISTGATGAYAFRAMVAQCGYAGLFLAAAGFALCWMRDRSFCTVLVLFGLVPALFGTHFEESDPSRYLLCAGVACAAATGTGLALAVSRPARVAGYVAAVLALVVLGSAFPSFAAQAYDRRVRSETDAIVKATPGDAVIVASWTLAPALAYRQRIEESTGKRCIVSAWYGEVADRLPDWLRRRRVYVSGPPEGYIEGYSLRRIVTGTELYSVVSNRSTP